MTLIKLCKPKCQRRSVPQNRNPHPPPPGFYFLNRRPVHLDCKDNGHLDQMYQSIFGSPCPGWSINKLHPVPALTYCCALFMVGGDQLAGVPRDQLHRAMQWVNGSRPPTSTWLTHAGAIEWATRGFGEASTWWQRAAAIKDTYREGKKRKFLDPPGFSLDGSVYPYRDTHVARLKMEADNIARLWHVLMGVGPSLKFIGDYHPVECGGYAKGQDSKPRPSPTWLGPLARKHAPPHGPGVL